MEYSVCICCALILLGFEAPSWFQGTAELRIVQDVHVYRMSTCSIFVLNFVFFLRKKRGRQTLAILTYSCTCLCVCTIYQCTGSNPHLPTYTYLPPPS